MPLSCLRLRLAAPLLLLSLSTGVLAQPAVDAKARDAALVNRVT